ncbi:MAG: hypothetical protein HYX71_01785 [Opitutae bacterium]|nr:hypothetical protein [Opitutae bacterium]
MLLAEHQRNIFLKRRDYDLALSAENRYRVNLMPPQAGPVGLLPHGAGRHPQAR